MIIFISVMHIIRYEKTFKHNITTNDSFTLLENQLDISHLSHLSLLMKNMKFANLLALNLLHKQFLFL